MRYVEKTPIDPRVAEVRSAPPAWDKVQNIRMPETVDEARAALALIELKIDGLVEAAERVPDRRDRYTEAASLWDEAKIKMEWALEVLKAGESPAQKELRALESRYNELLASFSQETDVQILIQVLQSRIRFERDRAEQYRMERMALEWSLDAQIEQTRRVEDHVRQRNEELKTAKAKILELEQTNTLLSDANESLANMPPPAPAQKIVQVRMMKETKDHWQRLLQESKAAALYVVAELERSGGVQTAACKHITARMLNGTSAEMRANWARTELEPVLEYLRGKGDLK